jgi:signal transduction histidine kinase
MGSDRIRQIILSLRNFSRMDEAEFKRVDIHEGIDNTLLILQHRLKENVGAYPIEVIKDYGQLPAVECFPAQLNQVFINLLNNAIDTLEQCAQQVQQCSPKIWISTQVIDLNRVQVMIADNGAGVPETLRSRVFDPFFTTKPIGKGTGLGLSISYQIVTTKHQGQMWCDSTLGAGSQFVIELPVHL